MQTKRTRARVAEFKLANSRQPTRRKAPGWARGVIGSRWISSDPWRYCIVTRLSVLERHRGSLLPLNSGVSVLIYRHHRSTPWQGVRLQQEFSGSGCHWLLKNGIISPIAPDWPELALVREERVNPINTGVLLSFWRFSNLVNWWSRR